MADSVPMHVILGPTASGKSALALEVASRLKGEILSVDSMQVYRRMDVGTAKPTPAERKQIRHHLIDIVEPDESFTVARFVKEGDQAIAEAQREGKPLVLTGGTPLYYKALFEGLFDGPPADEILRESLRALPAEELMRRVHSVDPEAASRLHRNDTRRLVRAVEVFELTGKPISSLQTDWARPALRYQAKWIGLQWDREALNRRINARVKSMLAAGWVEETRAMLDACGALSPTASEATGYHELMAHLRGELSLDDAAERIKIATRQLARRQMKWFRRWPQVRWIAGDKSVNELADEVLTND